MRKLLRANFTRLIKNKLFWILMALEFVMGAGLPVLHYLDNQNANGEWTLDACIFSYAMFVPILLSALAALFIGSEYSDGTMRNKLIVGHKRSNIYMADLIAVIAAGFLLCLAYIVPHICLAFPLLGWFTSDMKKIMVFMLVIFALVVAFAAIYTTIAMLCNNKAYSVASCILLTFILLFAGIRINAALNEPEIFSAYSYTENGVTIQEDESRNPNYVSGTKRQIYEFLNELLPGGQVLTLNTMEAEHPVRLAIYDGIIVIFTVGCGVFVFRHKDLK